MASILFRLLVLILALWLLRRFLARFLGVAHRPEVKNDTAGTPNDMVKDPVCGMYMDSRLAIRVEGRKQPVYFCSEECKNRYLGKTPAREEARNAPPV